MQTLTLPRSLRAGALALAFAAAPLASAGVGGGPDWFADFDKAAAAAKEQNKDLLVDFTGSDWCGWCIRLNEEVFSHEVWQKGVKDDYVLVALDFPSSEEVKAKVPNPERNDELKNKYGIGGFPTILLMTAEGDVFGQTGYEAGGPEAYLEHMAELRENRAVLFEVKERAAAFGALEDAAKWDALPGIMEAYASMNDKQPFRVQYHPAIRWGFENDTDNAKGVRLKAAMTLLGAGDGEHDYISVIRTGFESDADNGQGIRIEAAKALLAAGDDAHDYFAAVKALDPKNEAGHYEDVVGIVFQVVSDEESARRAIAALESLAGMKIEDKEAHFDRHFNAARWLAGRLGDEAKAKELATKALELGTSDEGKRKFLEDMIG